jgi:hypothetical protein
MSLCGICYGEIEDGKPMDEDNLSYCGCEETNLNNEDYDYD